MDHGPHLRGVWTAAVRGHECDAGGDAVVSGPRAVVAGGGSVRGEYSVHRTHRDTGVNEGRGWVSGENTSEVAAVAGVRGGAD